MKKDKQEEQSKKETDKNYNLATMGAFSVVTVVYFATAGYAYYKNIEGQVTLNIALGTMFFIIGLTFLVTKNKN